MARAYEYRPIKVSRKPVLVDCVGTINRMLKLLGDRTLSEVLLGATVLELWAVLIAFVFWLSFGNSSPEVDWGCKGLLIVGTLSCLVTGACAVCAWMLEREHSQKIETSNWNDWK